MEILYLLAILIGIIIFFVRLANPPVPIDIFAQGRALNGRFITLGNMIGKTADEITAYVGPPTSRSLMADDYLLLQWQATGYHIAILFDAKGRFVKITSEYGAPGAM
jgi:hypothetical protein